MITKEEGLKLKPGQRIRIYDRCSHSDKIEEIVRIETSIEIYSIQKHRFIENAERKNTLRDIKEVYNKESRECY